MVERDPFVDARASATATRILGNETHHGFVDNIFNYHTVLSPPVPDSHALLEKIRILQILRRRNANFVTIEASLLSLFGYRSNDLHTSIFILMKSQMIESVIDRNGSHTSIIFSLTGKGRICLNSLIFNMAYLEHVFHKTLFPARMLRLRSDDQPRQASCLPLVCSINCECLRVRLLYQFCGEQQREWKGSTSGVSDFESDS